MGLFKSSKPVREKPVKPGKEKVSKPAKPVKEKPVKEKNKKPKKGKEQIEINESENLAEQVSYDENLPDSAKIEVGPAPVNFNEGYNLEFTSNENYSTANIGSSLSTDNQLGKSVIKISGFTTTLENYFASMQSAALRSRKDGKAINVKWGDAMAVMIDIAYPGFITSIRRIEDGKLKLLGITDKFEVSNTSNSELKVYTNSFEDAYSKDIIMIGVSEDCKPTVSQAMFDVHSNKIVARFKDKPKVIAVISLLECHEDVVVTK